MASGARGFRPSRGIRRVRSGPARPGASRRRSGPGTSAASSSTSSPRWRRSGRSAPGGKPSGTPWRRQLAKRRAELSEGAPSPPPGSVASPISVRNGEDIDPDAGPAVKENGRSVAFKATSGYNTADYDADYSAMLTAEEEALRARTALMQREAELTAARAKQRELMAALEQAKHGTDDLLESLPRATLPPAPTEPSSTPLTGSVNNAGTFDPLNFSGGER